ncbi:sulfatase [uncultured Polaribacter sp.]|uniref:sulfatase n=1 Tax=uncultured Polaribacter sp. TaxID=174711 RepID=UPI002618637A|nr:sulfatase [uncultured Polaribacter sp.]
MKNNYSLFNKITIVIISMVFSINTYGQKKETIIKPNVIIFYADDLGWQDVELNDLDNPCAWDTPNISKLAKDAVNFTNAYSPAPTCAPSRCALLTGLHPTKVGVTNVSGGRVPKNSKGSNYITPFFPSGLMPEHYTIAEALKENGYTTGHVGKWHAGELEIQKSSNQGFDFTFESRGAHQGPKAPNNRVNFFATSDKNDPYRLSDEKYFPFTKDAPNGISYPKDAVTEKALEFIDKSKNKPFFLYLAHWMVHYPIHTKNRKLLEYYCDKLGVDFPKEDVDMTKEGQNNPYFGAMVTTLDWSLGRVVDLLKKTDDPRNPGKKLYETTYIFFSSDNGGAEKRKKEIMSDNAPLDKGKIFAQEGGIRVPMLISGPNVLKGKTNDVLINQLDFFPTILDLTKSKIAKKYEADFDGLDITEVLLNNENTVLNKEGEPREELWWHFPHNRMQSAIRTKDYKLYKNLTKGDYELYRLYKDGERADLEEQYNIAVENPEVVKDLSTRLEKYLKDYDAKFPYKNPLASENDAVASIPVIVNDAFDAKTRKFSVNLEAGKSNIIESYALIKIGDPVKASKNGKKRRTRTTYIKVPVNSSKNNLEHTVIVPKDALEYGVVLVDENRHMVQSKFYKTN